MGEMIDTLVLAAHPLELQGLSGALGRDGLQARAVGVGLAAAAVGSARALCELRPRRVLLIGSYGRYLGAGPADTAAEAGELLVPSELRWLDAAVMAGEAAFPEAQPIAATPDAPLAAALARSCGAVRAPLGVTAAITTDDGLAFRLAAAGCHGENLEALAVALACADQSVPFAALLGCTNDVGSRGRQQWRDNHAAVAHATAEAVIAFARS